MPKEAARPSAEATAVWLPFASIIARPSTPAASVKVMTVAAPPLGETPACDPVKASVRLSMLASAIVTFTEIAPPIA